MEKELIRYGDVIKHVDGTLVKVHHISDDGKVYYIGYDQPTANGNSHISDDTDKYFYGNIRDFCWASEEWAEKLSSWIYKERGKMYPYKSVGSASLFDYDFTKTEPYTPNFTKEEFKTVIKLLNECFYHFTTDDLPISYNKETDTYYFCGEREADEVEAIKAVAKKLGSEEAEDFLTELENAKTLDVD